MKNIKFRVWDGNAMWYPCEENDLMLLIGDSGYFELQDHGQGIKAVDIFNSADSDKAVLMQYTGLKDKNRKEIYHSDLLVDSDGRIWVVDFGDNDMDSTIASWTFQPVKPKGNRYPVDKVIAKFEIIGNIYDNPLPYKGN